MALDKIGIVFRLSTTEYTCARGFKRAFLSIVKFIIDPQLLSKKR